MYFEKSAANAAKIPSFGTEKIFAPKMVENAVSPSKMRNFARLIYLIKRLNIYRYDTEKSYIKINSKFTNTKLCIKENTCINNGFLCAHSGSFGVSQYHGSEGVA